MTAPADSGAQHQQAVQVALTGLLAAGMANAWPLIDLNDLPGSLPRYQTAVTALTTKFGQVSATQAARYYRDARLHAGVTGRFTPRPAPPASIGEVGKSLGWATKGLWSSQPDVATAKTLTNGVAQKLVTDTGRNTLIGAIEADKKCRGWAREARPDACSFCALMSIRGAVYRSEKTADFKAHDHCHCIPVPLFADHYEPPAHVREWQQLYADTPYGRNAAEARNNFRVALEQQRTGTPSLV